MEMLLGGEKLGLLICFVLMTAGSQALISGSPLLYVIH